MNIKELETPCFIIDTDEFKANLNDFKRALRKYYPNGILGKNKFFSLYIENCKRKQCIC